MIQLQSTRLSDSKSSEALDTPPERRMAPAIAVASLIIPPPPSAPPHHNKQNNQHPDLTAKAVLREVTDQVNQLMATSTNSAKEDESLLRMLSEKYVHGQLVSICTTPAVSFGSVKSLQKLTPTQHEVLQNLLRLPEKQLLKLPAAQLELVQFAKRYDKLVKATPDQLRHLPIEHQKLVRSMQRQQSYTDERR
eukprot:jgi/Phyca11/105767/e_gw1.11.833.1